jgi:hypothetical protein
MVKENTRNPNGVYIKIVSFFLLLTIASIFLILHFALAKVTISVKKSLEEKTATLLLEVQAETSNPLKTGALLGKIMTTEFELTTTLPTTAQTTTSTKASGYVTIYNNYSQDQTLVKTTRLLTADQKLYRITEKVNIPAGQSAQVWAEADQEGENLAIPGPVKLTIPGLWEGLQTKIYAEAKDGFKLQSLPKYLVTEANLAEAQSQLLAQAKKQSLENINKLLIDNLKIKESQLLLTLQTIKSSQLGEATPTISLTEKVTAHGLIFDYNDLLKVAKEKFSQELGTDQTLVEFKDGELTYQVTEVDTEKNQALLEITAKATISSKTNPTTIDKEKIVGLNKAQISDYLKSLKIEEFEIKFFPAWLTKAPKMKDRIIIE